MTPHATVDDLAAWLGTEPPAGAERLLRRASQVIDAAVTAPYTVDADRVATDTAVRDALRDATCAQAEWLADEADDLDLAGYDSVSIGSVTLGRRSDTAPAGEATYRVAPEAELILVNAGLTGAVVV